MGSRLAILLGVVLGAVACNEHPLTPVRYEHSAEATTSSCFPPPPKVDVLLVVDNSPSMGGEAETLAANLRGFMDVYETSGGLLDYRIAVTTTEVIGPACGGGASDAGSDGVLVNTSCRQRLEDFRTRASHEGPALDLREICLEHCPAIELPVIPTAVAEQSDLRPRPWIERAAGRHNYLDVLTPGDMLACMGLVGVSGCVWESPLEAAYRALSRMQDQTDPSYGFLRPDAGLFVLFIGDEGDCSIRPEHADILDPDGSRAFWPHDASQPTSAVCWNAAVECEGGPGTYEDCPAVNRGADAALAAAEDAVLQPVSRYIEMLQLIELGKQQATGTPWQRVFVGAIAGVPLGYGSGAQIPLEDSPDPAFQAAFGIGASCQSAVGLATPPARTREVVSAFAEFNQEMASLCAPDWTPALACLPGGPALRPACVESCVADADPSTQRLDPVCTVTQGPFNRIGAEIVIPDCVMLCGGSPCAQLDDEADDWTYPPGAEACVRWLQGERMSNECRDDGFNLELVVERRQTLWDGSCMEVTCEVSETPALDCPDL